jgi:hypothetical protein
MGVLLLCVGFPLLQGALAPGCHASHTRSIVAGHARSSVRRSNGVLTANEHIAAEIIKRRIPGLHQNTQIGSVGITDTWEPLEEGLNTLQTTRHVSVITITLSTAPLDTTSPGYQVKNCL